jgi:Skp family chaperone for outer membrane proteins
MKLPIYRLTLILLALAGLAQAEIRIATIDISRIIQESKSAKSKLQTIDRKAAEARKTIAARKEKLEAKEKNLTEDGDSAQLRELRQEARELQRYVTDTEDELKEEILAIRREVTQKAFTTVQKFAKSKGIDLVLEKNDTRAGPVLFANSAADITDEVLKIMQ